MVIRLFFTVTTLSLLISCSQRSALIEGGLYASQNKDGGYSVVKILKVEQGGVHIRSYSNSYYSLPSKIDELTLYMAGMNKKPNEVLGIGHMPISAKSFASWKITFIQKSNVTPEELDGYQQWKDDGGGYF